MLSWVLRVHTRAVASALPACLHAGEPRLGRPPKPSPSQHLASPSTQKQEAGKSAGMLTLAVPPSVAQRGSFPAANAMFDGFGAGGGLTYHKAGLMLAKHKQAQQ